MGFLYLISSWASSNAKMDYSGYPRFTKNDLIGWEKWYSKNSRKIIEADYHKSLNIYIESFKTGITSEQDIEYLHGINQKYNQY